jgi:ribokinase
MTGANSIWDDSFLDNIYFQKGDVVIAQFEIPDNVIKKTFLKAKKSRAITILNPAPIRNIDKSIKDNTDILIVNKVELEDLANTVINTLDNSIIFTHAKKLLESGYKTIIVTLGG